MESLYIAATGMHSHQTMVDVIANNLANLNTSGFKKSRVNFEDLMVQQLSQANGLLNDNGPGDATGIGTATASVEKIFLQGQLKKTENPLDVAIQGEGFFEVFLPDGSYAYSRVGAFRVDEDGYLANDDFNRLSSLIQLPPDSEEVVISANGLVQVRLAGEDQLTEIGQIELAYFNAKNGLLPLGDNLYSPTQESGDPYYQSLEQTNDQLVQGYLEGSNVEMVEELTNLVLAQRGYELNSRVIQVSDELLSIINGLRR